MLNILSVSRLFLLQDFCIEMEFCFLHYLTTIVKQFMSSRVRTLKTNPKLNLIPS